MRAAVAVAPVLATLLAFAHTQSAYAGSTVTFSESQVAAGRVVYDAHCAACHGGHLQGVVGPALAGGVSNVKGKPLGSVFRFITKSMPLSAAGSLSHTEYADIMAYILQQNGHRSGGESLDFASALRSSAHI